MQYIPIQTRVLYPPQDDFYSLIDESLTDIQEGDILVVTSKIMAIHQGRCIKNDGDISKHEIVKQLKYKYVEYTNTEGYQFMLTLIENALISSAGIDTSNGNGYAIYLPENPNKFCKEICKYVQKKFQIKNLAVIAVDSHSIPLRYGATGISIGFFGMKPLRNYIGKDDIFKEKLKVSRSNIVDSIAAASTLSMGEGNECCPFALVRGVKDIEFTDKDTSDELIVSDMREDMYYPMLKIFEQKKSGDSE